MAVLHSHLQISDLSIKSGDQCCTVPEVVVIRVVPKGSLKMQSGCLFSCLELSHRRVTKLN